jgi:hypothetical protein
MDTQTVIFFFNYAYDPRTWCNAILLVQLEFDASSFELPSNLDSVFAFDREFSTGNCKYQFI